MPKNKYTEKQMKIARVAEPRDSITGADFEAMNNSKMGGGMVKRPGYKHGGKVKGYRSGMSVNTNKGRGCGAAVSGRGYSGTY